MDEQKTETARKLREENKVAREDFFQKGPWTYVMNPLQYSELLKVATADELDSLKLDALAEVGGAFE